MKRDSVLDYAKGIVIILMVIGHCYSKENFLLTLIYGFHMPFFFVISGLIYGRKTAVKNFRFHPSRTIKNLLIPYYVYEMVFAIFISAMDRNNGFCNAMFGKIVSILTFKGVTATWYLSCIVFVELFFLLLYRRVNRKVLPVSAGVLVVGLLLARYVHGWITVLDRCAIGIGFFSFGFMIGEKVSVPQFNRKLYWVFPICAVLYVTVAIRNGMVSLVSLKIGNPLLYICSSILGTLVILMLALLVSRCKVGSRAIVVLEKMGRNTLFILGTHMLLVEIIRLLDYKITGNIFSKLGVGEGIVFGALVCVIEYASIPLYQRVKTAINQKYKECTHCA